MPVWPTIRWLPHGTSLFASDQFMRTLDPVYIPSTMNASPGILIDISGLSIVDPRIGSFKQRDGRADWYGRLKLIEWGQQQRLREAPARQAADCTTIDSAAYVVVGSHPWASDPTSAQVPVGGFRYTDYRRHGQRKKTMSLRRPRHESGSEGRRHILPAPRRQARCRFGCVHRQWDPFRAPSPFRFDEPTAGRVQGAAQRGA